MLLDGVPLDRVRYVVADGLYRTVAVKKFLADLCITFVSKPQTNKKNAAGPVPVLPAGSQCGDLQGQGYSRERLFG